MKRPFLMLPAILAISLTADLGDAAEMNMRVFQINDHLLSFYDGRPPSPASRPASIIGLIMAP